MNFKRLIGATASAASLSFLSAAALATNNTTTFNGTVPGSCVVTGGADTVQLTYGSDSFSTASGDEASFVVTCNETGDVTLGAVSESEDNPVSTTNTATLTIGSDTLISGDSAASGTIEVAANTATTATLELAATGATSAGDYVYTIVVTSLTDSEQ